MGELAHRRRTRFGRKFEPERFLTAGVSEPLPMTVEDERDARHLFLAVLRGGLAFKNLIAIFERCRNVRYLPFGTHGLDDPEFDEPRFEIESWCKTHNFLSGGEPADWMILSAYQTLQHWQWEDSRSSIISQQPDSRDWVYPGLSGFVFASPIEIRVLPEFLISEEEVLNAYRDRQSDLAEAAERAGGIKRTIKMPTRNVFEWAASFIAGGPAGRGQNIGKQNDQAGIGQNDASDVRKAIWQVLELVNLDRRAVQAGRPRKRTTQ